MRVAFSKKFKAITNNSAKLQALFSGIRLGKESGYKNICIQTNSTLVVGWLQG